jgi:ComEC/Rec2-related protein
MTTSHRPALRAGVAFALGVWVAGTLAPTSAALILSTVALLCVFIWSLPAPTLRSAFVYLLLIGAGASRFWLVDLLRPENDLKFHPDSNASSILYGTVDSEPDVRSDATFLYVSADSVDYGDSVRARRGRALVRLGAGLNADYGEQLALHGALSATPAPRNPGEFDYAAYLRRRDVFAELIPDTGRVILGRSSHRDHGWTASLVAPAREWINARISRHLHGEHAALALGLLFGERKILSRETLAQFQNTGTLHLLAVSGSNVAVVIGVAWGLLALLRAPRTLRVLITLVVLVFFCALSRNQPSVVRASVAGGLALVGLSVRRSVNPLNIWGAALLCLLFVSPAQLFDTGFQLSFAAAAGIIVAAPLLHRPKRRRRVGRFVRYILFAMGVSLAAQIAVAPILTSVFNRVPLVTPLSNLICVPLAGVATAAGIVTVILAPLGGWFLSAASAASWLCLEALLGAVALFSRFSLPVWTPATGALYEIALYYALVLLLFLFAIHSLWRRRVLFGLVLLANLWVWIAALTPQPAFQAVILDAGRESLSAVRWPDGRVWVIAGPDSSRRDNIALTLQPFLRRHGWNSPEQIWPMDSSLHEDAFSVISPRASYHATPIAAGTSRSDAPYSVRCFADRSNRPAALCIEADGWRLVWVRNLAVFQTLPLANDRPTWAVGPGVSDLDFDIPPSYVTFIEIGGSARDKAKSLSPHVIRTVTAGGIVASESNGRLCIETSIR